MTQRYHVTLKHLQVAGLLLDGYQYQMLILSATLLHKAPLRDRVQAFRLVYCCTLKHLQALGHLLDNSRQVFRPELSAVRARQAISAWHSLSSALWPTALSRVRPAREQGCLLIRRRRYLPAVFRLPQTSPLGQAAS